MPSANESQTPPESQPETVQDEIVRTAEMESHLRALQMAASRVLSNRIHKPDAEKNLAGEVQPIPQE